MLYIKYILNILLYNIIYYSNIYITDTVCYHLNYNKTGKVIHTEQNGQIEKFPQKEKEFCYQYFRYTMHR